MVISLRELELRSVRFSVDLPPGELTFGGELKQISVLHSDGIAELVNEILGEIRIRGNLTVSMRAQCDRCLEDASVDLDRSFNLVYVPFAAATKGGEDSIDEAAAEIGYYEGSGLDLNSVLQEVVLLALPMQVICRETCKGICPNCGQNRNQNDCNCQAKLGDDRWSKLKQIRIETGSHP